MKCKQLQAGSEHKLMTPFPKTNKYYAKHTFKSAMPMKE